jgi:ATP synthase protein I
MNGHAPDQPPGDFDARLKRLKEQNAPEGGQGAERPTSGYGMAFTIATDLVGGLIGGALIGWLLDRWLGSAPWGMIGFFFLGAVAGMWNVYRTVRGYDPTLGFQARKPQPAAGENETQRTAGARPDNEGGDRGGQSTSSVRNQDDRPD